MLNDIQFSAYDERPGFPKNSGQGHLFRNQAPAMSPERRYSKKITPEGDRLGTMYHGTIADLHPGDQIKSRNETGIDARSEAASYVGLGAEKYNANAHTFATHDPEEAARYARDAAIVHKEKTGRDVQPRVYSVRMRANYSERDPEYYGTGAHSSQNGIPGGLPRDYFETPHGERMAEHHGRIGEAATAGSHYKYDDSGNFLAHRSSKPLRVTNEVQFVNPTEALPPLDYN